VNAREKKTAKRAEQALRTFHEEGAIGKAYDARLLRRLWHPVGRTDDVADAYGRAQAR